MKKAIAVIGLLVLCPESQLLANSFSVNNGQTVTASQTLASGEAGTVDTAGVLSVSGGGVAVAVTGDATIDNYGMILQTGDGRAIRDNTGKLSLTVTNYAGATIQTADADVIQMNKKNSSVAFYNYGEVISLNASDGGAQAIDFNSISSGSNVLYNYASGVITANEADAVRPGANGFVYNDGTIQATNNAGSTSSSDGVDAQENSGITVVNATTGSDTVAGTGLIDGARHGITGGNTDTSTDGTYLLNVTNNLGGIIRGDDGSGINIDGFNANEVVTITNHGSIIGNGVTGDGDGVDVDGVVHLVNTGTIRSVQALNDVSEGLTVGGGNIINSGTIEGDNVNGGIGRGITLAGLDKDPDTGNPMPAQGIYADTTVTNSGLIRGQSDSGIAVTGAAGSFSLTITNLAGGTIQGGGASAAALNTGANDATVIDYGTITADNSGKAIDLGSGDSRLQILGGSAVINGDISGGTGSSLLLINPGSGNAFDYDGAISQFDGVTIGGGTVTLSGINSYSGGTTIIAGTLSVSSDASLGATSADLTLDGGTLAVTGNTYNNTARTITLGAAGGGFDIDAADNTFTVTQALAGSGALSKTGAGTLLLSGANSYTGGTAIEAGTLRGDSSSLQGDITDDAMLVFDQATDGSYSGVVSGSGALTKVGSGTLVLAGANRYSGGTTISAGTLQGDTQSLQGAITDSGTLVFDQASDGIYAGTLSGQGALIKRGNGELVFNGSSPFDGVTSVVDGTLVIGDDRHADAALGGTISVASDAMLTGIGHVGNLNLAGTVAPGQSIGTLRVDGDATFEKGSRYDIDVSADGQSDQVVVHGHATILGGSALAIGTAGNWSPMTSYTIVSAEGGVSGQFDGVSSTLAFLTPTLGYNTNTVTLALERNDVDFAAIGQTANQRATGAAAQALGYADPLFGALVTLEAGTARQAFDQLSGESYASTRTTLVDDSRHVRDAINRHLLGNANEANGTEAAADGVTAWTSVFGHSGNHDSDGNASRLTANGSGLLVGADLADGHSGRAGFLLGKTRNSAQVDARGSTSDTTGTLVGLYASTALGGFDLRAGASYTWQDVDATRRVDFVAFQQRLTSSYHARTTQVYVEGGYRFDLGAGQQLEPFANLARVGVRTDAVHEAGGSAALQLAGDSSTVNTATLGLRDTLELSDVGDIRAHGSLGWQQAWGDLAPVSRSRFVAGDATFNVAGVPVARHALAVDAGLSFHLARQTSVDLSYVGQFASDASDQGVRMSLRLDF